jgi:hypothetical protein
VHRTGTPGRGIVAALADLETKENEMRQVEGKDPRAFGGVEWWDLQTFENSGSSLGIVFLE